MVNMHTGKPCPDGSHDDDLKHKLNVGHVYIVLKEDTPEASLKLVSEWMNAEQISAFALSEATLIKLGIQHGLELIKASSLVNPQISVQTLSSKIVSECIARVPANAIHSTTRWVLELGTDKYPNEFLQYYNNFVNPKMVALSPRHFEENCKAVTKTRPLLMLNTSMLAYDPAGCVPRMPPAPNDARYVRVEDMHALGKNNEGMADAAEEAMAKNRNQFMQEIAEATCASTSRALIRTYEQMLICYVYQKPLTLFRTAVVGKFDATKLPDLQRDF